MLLILDHDVPSIDSVPVVNEYLYVFTEDFPGIPPLREVDFGIDLEPGTKPISIPLYHYGSNRTQRVEAAVKTSH